MLDIRQSYRDHVEVIAESDIFKDFLAKEVERTASYAKNHEFSDKSTELLFPDYFEADKTLGAGEADAFHIIALKAMSYLQVGEVPDTFKVSMLELAASASREVAFVETIRDHNSIESVDERLFSIEASDEMLDLAINHFPVSSEQRHRLQLDRDFSRVHMDIISGEVTQDTVQETLDLLRTRRYEIFDIADKAAAVGLKGEIEVLEYFWRLYKKRGDKVAIPATMRGRSGRSNAFQTHDIDVIRQKNDGSWHVLPYVEVKHTKITDAMKQRYAAIIAHVGLNSAVTFHTDHRPPKTEKIA